MNLTVPVKQMGLHGASSDVQGCCLVYIDNLWSRISSDDGKYADDMKVGRLIIVNQDTRA